jgi:L,D-peptidoglycan transpeptidase YkuD (ErfK/YbiS/YcfS/YnhG family)
VPRSSSRLAACALAALTLAACSTSPGAPGASTPPDASSAGTTPVTSSPAAPSTPVSSLPSTTRAAPSSTPHSTTPKAHEQHTPAVPSRSTSSSSAARSSGRLPLGYRTGSATQVVTVTAPSTGSTTATLQAWSKSGSGWRKVGPAVPAFVGSNGMSTHTHEGLSATPMGSFTLTQAFGANSDPGTDLPYCRTTPADWWISQTSGAGADLYNTHQRCASNCAFTRGDPNEHLHYETPYYNYAVVIDYNTANAPGGVRQGAGSAFFLHVHPSGTGATAGCVSIPQDQLVRIMRWLDPAAHPRILIGVS